MKRLLLDTSVVIDFLRRPDKENSLFYKLTDEELFISIITHTELYAGKSIWEKIEVKKTVERTLSGLQIISLSPDISKKAGYIKVHNQGVSLIDAIIAATAIKHSLLLSTLNLKDFEKINDLKII
ncbi:PIN domain-containing protein [Candidatus Curtissbacteria bacterium]|nr:PIN domain-containing protein [Candidatus Curtissbacteria bacterium]